MKNYKFARMGRSMLMLALSFILIAGVFTSCSSDNSADVRDLLQCVPADASAVMVVNTSGMLKNSGCKIDGDKATLSKELEAAINRNSNEKSASLLKDVMTGEAGNTLGPVAVFLENYNTYITGNIADPSKFKDWAEKSTGQKAESSNGVDVVGNVGIKGNRYWAVINGANYVKAEDVARFAGLSEKTSYLANPYSEKIIKSENDIEGWGEVRGIYRLFSSGNVQQDVLSNLLVSSLFDDAQNIAMSFNFLKGKAEGTLSVLNSKGEYAKFLLPVSKIDESTVAGLGKSTEVVGAMAVSSKFVEKIEELAKSFGGGLPSAYLSQLKPIDGTACVAVSEKGGLQSAIVTTNGEGLSNLTSMLGSFGKVVKDGKLLRIEKSPVEGSVDISEAAKAFKGAMIGVRAGKFNGRQPMKYVTVLFVPESNSLKLKFTLTMADSDANALEVLLGAI